MNELLYIFYSYMQILKRRIPYNRMNIFKLEGNKMRTVQTVFLLYLHQKTFQNLIKYILLALKKNELLYILYYIESIKII